MLQSDSEFRLTGLKADSLIRLDKLVTLSRGVISRRLGTTGPATKAKIAAMLRRALEHPISVDFGNRIGVHYNEGVLFTR